MRLVPLLRWSVAALLVLAVAAWFAVRRLGVLPPYAVAALAAAVLVAAAAAFAADLASLASQRRLATAASALVFGGVLLAGGAGLVGWTRSVQGYALLAEGEPLSIASVADLQKHWGGPLGSVEELRGTLLLEKLSLAPAERGFSPVSRVVLRAASGATSTVEVTPVAPASLGTLRLHQGAFGFAPRLVVLREGRTLLDQHVPFRTRVLEDRAVAFDGEVDVPSEDVHVAGEVDISSLDERMRGHPTLYVRIQKGGKEIGGGELRPGHSAELEGGYRIVYAGLRRWSEIDVRRRGPVGWVRVGLYLAAAGLLLWPLAAWRRW